MDKLERYRVQWWNQGNLHPMAEWDEIKCWEWDAKLEKNGIVLGDVTIYELPSQSHEVCIGKIISEINRQCIPVMETDAEIYSFGATRTHASGFGKESDLSFRPRKPKVISPYESDGKNKPWPNLVVEVAFSESVGHVKENAHNYWLHNDRVHDVIVVKIDYVTKDQIPQHMKVWHYCVSGTYVQQKLKPINK
ncbi:14258_t:CDS:2, partial [Entrophospora sp. SA101]